MTPGEPAAAFADGVRQADAAEQAYWRGYADGFEAGDRAAERRVSLEAELSALRRIEHWLDLDATNLDQAGES